MRLRTQRTTAAVWRPSCLASGLSACQSGSTEGSGGAGQSGQSGSEAVAEEKPDPVRLSTSFTDPAAVPIDARGDGVDAGRRADRRTRHVRCG